MEDPYWLRFSEDETFEDTTRGRARKIMNEDQKSSWCQLISTYYHQCKRFFWWMSTCFSFISEGGIVFHMNTPTQLKIRGHTKWCWTTSMVSRANTSPVNIGAGAFIAPGVIAAGVPCKLIRPITEKDKFKPEDILFWEIQIGNAGKTYAQALRGHFCFSPCFSVGRRHGILKQTTRNLKGENSCIR